MKISFFKSVTLTLIFCLGLSPLQANTPEAPRNASNQQIHQAIQVNPQNIQTFLTLSFLALAANKENKTFTEQFEPITFAKNFAEVYGTATFVTFLHEFSHSLMSYILEKSNINVHMGSTRQNEAIFSLGPIHVEGFNPFIGHTRGVRGSSKVNRVAVLAAGPIGGVVGYYLIKVIKNIYKIYKQDENQSHTQKIKTGLKNAFTKASPLDCFALFNFLYLFIPNTRNGDSTQIWKTLGADPEFTNKLSDVVGPTIISTVLGLFALQQMLKATKQKNT